MLEELTIKSVGGIQEACLRFGPGLTVITGESGTGKSSIIRALEMVSGKRVTSASVKAGDEIAEAEAVFTTNQTFPLLDREIAPQDQTVILKRTFSSQGRGKCTIQGRTVPLTTLIDVSAELLTLQSQFAQLALLDSDEQLRLLDEFGGSKLIERRAEIGQTLRSVLDAERDLRNLAARESELQSRFAESERVRGLLGLRENDETPFQLENRLFELEKELKTLRDVKNRRRQLDDGEGGGLRADLTETLRGLEDLHSDEREDFISLRETIIGALDGLCQRLDNLAPSQSLSDLENEVEETESRLGQLRKALRLSNLGNFEELSGWLDEAKEAERWLNTVGERRASLTEMRKAGMLSLLSCTTQLRESRRQAAKGLTAHATKHLSDLAMADAGFSVLLHESDRVRASGTESAEFVLRRGDSVVPVAKGASGGELSRVLLAIQLALPREELPETIAFDEVEAGLGGRAAYLTGLKLKNLSRDIQVILVTHEAIIASQADRHYGVTRDGNMTCVIALDGAQREKEIARMLSGDGQDEKALLHARHLLSEKRHISD